MIFFNVIINILHITIPIITQQPNNMANDSDVIKALRQLSALDSKIQSCNADDEKQLRLEAKQTANYIILKSERNPMVAKKNILTLMTANYINLTVFGYNLLNLLSDSDSDSD